MTIARKLWLGFGGLILIFLVASLIILLSVGAITRNLGEMVQVEEPARAASYEMEINTVEISQDVLAYLNTGDPQYRKQFANDKSDFEKFNARYDELVDTPKERASGA